MDIVTSRVFVDGERGITAAKLNDITASSSIQPAFYTSKPTGSTADPTDIALILKSGAYTQVPVSTLAGSVNQAQIWSTRLLSFNSVGNPDFEVDQKNCNAVLTNPAAGLFVADRWIESKTGTMTVNTQVVLGSVPDVALPGTNFRISRSYLRLTLGTQQSVLGASDSYLINQVVEGCNYRELQTDVHSVSLLVRSSVAGLKFGLTLRDPPAATKSLTKLCTIPSANIWTLIQLSNLPVWPSGNFSGVPGVAGYQFTIVLAAGTAATTAANDTWQSANVLGAVGQSNFAASAVNSTFDIAFVQHEPGPVCTTLMDKPFSQNLDECQRYYTKSYPYGIQPGTVNSAGIINATVAANIQPSIYTPFKKTMAKTPAIVGYSPTTGAANAVRDIGGTIDRAISSSIGLGDSGFSGFSLTAVPAAGWQFQYHYTADTGW